MEELKHECGVAMIRLRKPLDYYNAKYGNSHYALNKLYLLMQKQYNRGQEGAGIACVSLNTAPGEEFMFRERKEGKSAINEIFSSIGQQMDEEKEATSIPYIGECYMGHLRYSTTGKSGLTYVHPHLRRSNYRRNTLAFCGNFNLTNTDEILERLKVLGQHPRRTSDTTLLLEQLGDTLDHHNGDLKTVVRECMPTWDGGFVMCGMTGTGEMVAVRDPWGIRTAFWYEDEEIIVVASERPAIQTIMNVDIDDIKEIQAGEAIHISADGKISSEQIVRHDPIAPCSFERIYFSRGNDRDIYQERKELGRALVPQLLKAIDNDIDNTIFSFIPNTAETAYMGMLEGLNDQLNKEKCEAIQKANTPEEIAAIISRKVRTEKIAIKDIKLRTFISESGSRNELANHVYDITYGVVRPNIDNLVIIDDSIVRGTTLKNSIITILSRLKPKKMIIVSSAPQIRYPDFYGIDMSNMGDLIAFRAAMALSDATVIDKAFENSINQVAKDKCAMVNYVASIYNQFTDEQISRKIADLVTSDEVTCPVEIIYQTREALAKICKNHRGDWYFTGNYPTHGGVKQLNQVFIDYMKKNA